MDKLRVILKVVWRERFWVLSVVGVLVAVVCWQMSSGALDAEFNSRKGQIEGQFTAMQGLAGEATYPNNNVNDKNREQAREQTKNVMAVWQELYDRQRKEVLSWPKDSLSPQFIETIEKLKFRDPFPVREAEFMRTHYWNYIGNRFDGLLKIPKALKTDSQTRRFGGGGGRGGEGDAMEFEGGGFSRAGRTSDEPVDQDYLVEWLDQNNLRSKLQFKAKPTAVQIWVTQEDLWVYETLLSVIAETNKERGTTRPDNAAVRVIENLEVGRSAAAASRQKGTILMPSAGAVALGGESEERIMPEGDAPIDMREDDFAGAAAAEAEISDDVVLGSRYLDPEGNPYPGAPEDKEYRRLPVRMRLVMDQRYLPLLLVECANAALPVEVKQVRINPEEAGAGFGGSESSYSRNRGSRALQELGDDPNLAEVEIRGVVFIYNQPDESVFEGLGGDEAQLAAE